MRKSTPSKQIPMDLAPAPDYSFARFMPSPCNTDALTLIKGWQNWPAPVLLLQGPKGAGKTHLGRAWAKDCGAQVVSGAGLTLVDVSSDTVFIDDAETAEPQALFALINRALAGEITALLLSTTLVPQQWPHDVPDLHSRMKNTAVATLHEVDEALLEAVMRKMFDDLGRTVGRDVVDYITLRCERSVPALRAIVSGLDSAARADNSDLTKAYAVRYLNAQPDMFD